jgi:hypothetical protein
VFRDAQIQAVSSEYEGLKKGLASHETAREIDETERRLKVCSVVLCYVIMRVLLLLLLLLLLICI